MINYFLLINKKILKSEYIMKANKLRKSRQPVKKKQEVPASSKNQIIKFNFSYDNLKCFINDKHPKTDRKHPSTKNEFSMTDSKKYRQQQQQKQAISSQRNSITREKSPQPFLFASNEILLQIQKNGTKCVWSEIEQSKTEVSNEEEWLENQRLNQTFSECSSYGSYRKNISHASTVDGYSHLYYPHAFSQSGAYSQSGILIGHYAESYVDPNSILTTNFVFPEEKIRFYDPNVFEIDPYNIGNDPRTTLMIKNIPNKYTIQDLSNEIDQNFFNNYDFLYLPCDIKNNCNVGYGFINFQSLEVLSEFYKRFHNKKWMKFRSDKICVLTYARLQGLSSLIEHFQNSKVLNHKDKRYQPIIKKKKEIQKMETLIKQQKIEQSSINM